MILVVLKIVITLLVPASQEDNLIAFSTQKLMIVHHVIVSGIIFIVAHNKLIMTDEFNDTGRIEKIIIRERCQVKRHYR